MTHLKHFCIALLVTAASWSAGAQTYPNKPVHIIEPAGPGSAVDVFARKLGIALGEKWGQTVIVDNKPGANGMIGAREGARSAPDGYTLFHGNINNALNDVLLNDTCCKLTEAMIPVTLLTSTALVMVVTPSLGVKNWKEYLARASRRTSPSLRPALAPSRRCWAPSSTSWPASRCARSRTRPSAPNCPT
jgi:tripartite-type tricarboxylate transporter receptor subunit TctC